MRRYHVQTKSHPIHEGLVRLLMRSEIQVSDDFNRYRSPLETRYASDAMQKLWSDAHRFGIWRRLWLALAESQQQLGLDISDQQLSAIRNHLDDIDYRAAAAHEKRLRHDVMAHVHTLGDLVPEARGIIHLGATSQFVNCNAELLILRDAMRLIAAKTASIIVSIGSFAAQWKDLPTLGFTHYQCGTLPEAAQYILKESTERT